MTLGRKKSHTVVKKQLEIIIAYNLVRGGHSFGEYIAQRYWAHWNKQYDKGLLSDKYESNSRAASNTKERLEGRFLKLVLNNYWAMMPKPLIGLAPRRRS